MVSILNKSLINEHMGEARIPEEEFSPLLKKYLIRMNAWGSKDARRGEDHSTFLDESF